MGGSILRKWEYSMILKQEAVLPVDIHFLDC